MEHSSPNTATTPLHRQADATLRPYDATLRPYDADDNVPHAIVIMRISRRALELIIRDGPAGFRPGATTEEKRRDFIRHVVDDEYNIGAGRPDFDHFTIRGKPSILNNIIGLRPSVHSNPPTHNFEDYVLVASTPFYVWVPKSYEDAIADYFGDLRGVTIIKSPHQHLVFSQSMYFSDDDFLNMFVELEIEDVIVKCYGEKAGLPWGMKVMRLCREGDPSCEISFDAAISIPPHMMHWGKSEHMVPSLPDNDSFLTLARLTNHT